MCQCGFHIPDDAVFGIDQIVRGIGKECKGRPVQQFSGLEDQSAIGVSVAFRHPGMSFVAEVGAVLCGCVMCGHDGRRGYLQHLIVIPQYRRQGMANTLVERCLSTLEKHGILKCHFDVFKTNFTAANYWHSQGWQLRSDIDRYSFTRSDNENV